MTLYLPSGRPVHLAEDGLGSGREGMVVGLADMPDLCVKLYYDPPADGGAKLDALIRSPLVRLGGDHAEHQHLAWPLARLTDGTGLTRGVLMPRVGGAPLDKLFDPVLRADALEEPTWRTVLVTAARTARLMSMLHAAGAVMGDLSPANIMVSRTGHVTLIDCDTVQFRDAATGRMHPCTKVTPEYAPPEAHSAPRGAVLETHHDSFGLAVLICQLLMEGQHPFEGVPADGSDTDDVESNVRLRRNRITRPELLVPMANELPAPLLPPTALALARQCFEPGLYEPARRPGPEAWFQALDQAGFELMGCRFNARHLYHRSLGTCVWCARVARNLGESYPSPVPSVGGPAWAAPAPAASQAGPASADTREQSEPPVAAPPAPPATTSTAESWDTVKAVLTVLAVIAFVVIRVWVL